MSAVAMLAVLVWGACLFAAGVTWVARAAVERLRAGMASDDAIVAALAGLAMAGTGAVLLTLIVGRLP